MFRGAKKRTFRFGKKNVSFPKVETFRFADYIKVETLLRRSHYPLFFEPLRSLLYFVSTNNKYYLKECPHPDMRKFCDKRNIHLVYLTTER